MKSEQGCKPAKHKSNHAQLLTMFGGLLLLFPLLLPATALAAPQSATAAPPLTKPQQIVDLAGVSVVRLAVGYVPANGNGNPLCTALGTILASWAPSSTSEQNTWVLTDGSLLSPKKTNTCSPGGTLASISLFASNEYTGNRSNLAALDTLNCTSPGGCSDTGGKQAILTLPNGSATLFSFHTSSPLPYIDVERTSANGRPAPTSIELASSSTTLPPSATKNVNAETLTFFLTPIATASAPGSAPATAGTTSEPGMPYVDGNGKITGMQLSNTLSLLTIAEIETLEGQIAVPGGATLPQKLASNIVSQQWDTGIIQYEQGQYQAAFQTLNSIQNGPATFQAPATFAALAHAKLPSNGSTSGSTTSPSRGGSTQGLSSWLVFIGLIAVIGVLISLFFFVSIHFGRKRIERIKAQEPEGSLSVYIRTDLELLFNLFKKLKQAFQTRASNSKPLVPEEQRSTVIPANQELLCPKCGQKIPSGAAFCPNCRYSLVPNAQSFRATVDTSPAPQPALAAPLTRKSVQPRPQPQQPPPAPKMQDDPAIRAALQRLWDRAGR